MPPGRFLAMIGALIRHPTDHRYLILQRSPEKDFAAGEYECVTGRVDQGESFTEALIREVREELGVDIQIEFILGATHFYRGPARPEYEMLGVLYCCSINEPDSIRKSWEHSEFHWVTAEEARAFLHADHWLLRLILAAERIRDHTDPDLLVFYQENGFEF